MIQAAAAKDSGVSRQKPQSLIIGQKFPVRTDGAIYDTPTFQLLGSESAMVIWKIKAPTNLELNDFNNGKIEIGVRRIGKLMFFCINQQPFANGDSAFHPSRFDYPRDMHMMHASNDVGLPVYLCIVDEKNVLRALRCINLNKAVTDEIADIFEYQRSEDGLCPTSQYKQMVINAYKVFPTTEALMKSCEKRCTIKGRIL